MDIVRRCYQVLQSADTGAIGMIIHENFVNHGPIGAGIPRSAGRDGIGDDVISLHRAFPDLDVIVADVFAERDKVVARVIAAIPTSARYLTCRAWYVPGFPALGGRRSVWA